MATTWRAIRKLWAAIALGSFPWLFIIDEQFSFAFSPVLPGLLALMLLWALLPYGHAELALRQARTLEWAQRQEMRAKYALGGAVAWLVLWVVFA